MAVRYVARKHAVNPATSKHGLDMLRGHLPQKHRMFGILQYILDYFVGVEGAVVGDEMLLEGIAFEVVVLDEEGAPIEPHALGVDLVGVDESRH